MQKDIKNIVDKLRNSKKTTISFKDKIPKNASLSITKYGEGDKYVVIARTDNKYVNLKNFHLCYNESTGSWTRDCISAVEAARVADVVSREISRSNKLLRLGDITNLRMIAAKWDTKFINELPDAAFAVVKSGGNKINSRTVPKDLRMLPHHNKSVNDPNENSSVDKSHLRNALSRVNQSSTDLMPEQRARAKAHLEKHAKALKIGKYSSSIEKKINKLLQEMKNKDKGE